ncbi:hypothetical protein [Winogradskyella sp.]|uniref:hypothetical protein n=1 Tax=Winogradskyella sp. TaxID=1883156 RepID=UPI0026057501|nr:hypothetical protein [uncultured Winogradskyella sp.]
MVEEIKYKDNLLAIIVSSKFEKDGIAFFTPNSFSQQLGYMKREKDYVIEPHVHNPVKREVVWTQEVLFIKSGKVRVDFYDEEKIYLKSRVLEKGDIILLAAGGHGFEMLEESEIIEVKQGPYSGDKDKTRFEPVDSKKIQIIE